MMFVLLVFEFKFEKTKNYICSIASKYSFACFYHYNCIFNYHINKFKLGDADVKEQNQVASKVKSFHKIFDGSLRM